MMFVNTMKYFEILEIYHFRRCLPRPVSLRVGLTPSHWHWH